jgi:hypothetical protein
VIFSDGVWPGIPGQTPYLPSIEALIGWLARASGVSAGTLVYSVLPPIVAFASVWTLWMLFRAWGARYASSCLVLACVFLLWGGNAHASWGNLHIARIWQGKVTFLAVVVPLVFAAAAAFWTARGDPGRRSALAVVGLCAVAGIGLTPAAVFVGAGVACIAAVPGLVQRRWADTGMLLAVGAGPPLLAGVVALVLGQTSGIDPVNASTGEDPWQKVLGYGLPAQVVIVAAVVTVLGVVWPSRWSASGSVGRVIGAASVAAGLLIAVPPVFDLAVALMGTDAIAWRLTWLVPVPALVGLLAGLPLGSWLLTRLVGLLVAGLLVWSGLPLWSAANNALVTAPGAWKVEPAVLGSARWIAAQEPASPVLAPVAMSAALGMVSADVAPVGSRSWYLDAYADVPEARVDDRRALQRLTDGVIDPADLARAPDALDRLDVDIACSASANVTMLGVLEQAGFTEAYVNGPWECWVAPRAG